MSKGKIIRLKILQSVQSHIYLDEKVRVITLNYKTVRIGVNKIN
jgi:hypothetical protein